jgi:hypothetical protein
MCPSTIDWCEANYQVTDLIAEFWNSVTGVAILISAVYWRISTTNPHTNTNSGNYAFTGPYAQSFKTVFWYLILVAVGTTMFHGTLLYKYQLLDELPMLLISMEYVRLMSTFLTSRVCFGSSSLLRINQLLKRGKYMIIVIPFTYMFGPYTQILSFHITLKVFEGTLLYLLFHLSGSLNQIVYTSLYTIYDAITEPDICQSLVSIGETSYVDKNRNSLRLRMVQKDLSKYLLYRKELTYHTVIGIKFYVGSVAIWVLENLFCDYVRPLQLHAWWHVSSSLGIYHLNKLVECHCQINDLVTETNNKNNYNNTNNNNTNSNLKNRNYTLH